MGLKSSRSQPAFERTQCRAGAIRGLHAGQLSQLAAARSNPAKVTGIFLVNYTTESINIPLKSSALTLSYRGTIRFALRYNPKEKTLEAVAVR